MMLAARIFVVLSCLFGWQVVHATIIEVEITELGGGAYQSDYTVINNNAFAIEQITWNFEFDLYASLRNEQAPTNWDPFVIDTDGSLDPALGAGLFDVCAAADFFCFPLVDPIAAGDTLGGFSIVFDWLGIGDPTSQSFDINLNESFFDPSVGDFGDTVVTKINRLPSMVSEPGTLGLLFAGIFLIRGRFRALK